MRHMNDIYSRQQDLEGIHTSILLIVGVGGVGSWVALNAALSGKFDKIVLIDPDIVEMSNLNRTPFRLKDVNSYKCDALKYLILERRAASIITINNKTTDDGVYDRIKSLCRYSNSNIIIDCRDDIYEDLYDVINVVKYYKLGYDGLSITMDGNPEGTAVWGRADSYSFTPSFVVPAQLLACLVIHDIVYGMTPEEDKSYSDVYNRLSECFTINVSDIIPIMYKHYNSVNERTL